MYYDDSEKVRIYSLPEERVVLPSNSQTRAAFLLENNRLLTITDTHSYVFVTED